jgi:ComF family protein
MAFLGEPKKTRDACLPLPAILAGARRATQVLLDAVLPPQCLSCNAPVDAPGNLCADCFGKVSFITAPHCHRCGIPLETPIVDDVVCGACLAEPPAFAQARAVFLYTPDSRPLILKFKHGDRTDAAGALARWMQRAGADLLERCDVLAPVPLHRRRLFMRMYNQAALLANALGRLAQRKVSADALARVKATPMQGGLDRAARRRNVARAFAVKRPAAIEGQRVLLIDDVLTTGATANACAEVLLRAGARAVDVLVVARVGRPDS